MKVNAMRASVFRSNLGDCSNGGISSRFDEVLVVCDEGNVELDTEDLPENVVIVLEKYVGAVYAQPWRETDPGHVGWMAGGTLIYSSDSRFRRIFGGPLILHDRQETTKQYEILSR